MGEIGLHTHAQNGSTRSVKTTKTKFEGCVASIGHRDWIVSDIAAEHHVVVLLIVCQTERCLIVMVWRRKKREEEKKSHKLNQSAKMSGAKPER